MVDQKLTFWLQLRFDDIKFWVWKKFAQLIACMLYYCKKIVFHFWVKNGSLGLETEYLLYFSGGKIVQTHQKLHKGKNSEQMFLQFVQKPIHKTEITTWHCCNQYKCGFQMPVLSNHQSESLNPPPFCSKTQISVFRISCPNFFPLLFLQVD